MVAFTVCVVVAEKVEVRVRFMLTVRVEVVFVVVAARIVGEKKVEVRVTVVFRV